GRTDQPVRAGKGAGAVSGHVALRILAEEAAQAPTHREGVLRLLAAALALPTKRVTSRWDPAEALTLAGGPDRDTAALVADLHVAALRRLTAGSDLARVRTAAAFDRWRTDLRDRLEDEVYAVAKVVVGVLAQARATEKAVASSTSLALLDTLTDVKAQLSG